MEIFQRKIGLIIGRRPIIRPVKKGRVAEDEVDIEAIMKRNENGRSPFVMGEKLFIGGLGPYERTLPPGPEPCDNSPKMKKTLNNGPKK